MYSRTPTRFALILLSSAFITGCDGTKKILGLERQKPDEFNVMQPAPLSMPPRFDELPTPQPGAQRPQEQSSQEKARLAVTGDMTAPSTDGYDDSAEDALLKRAGAKDADTNIRSTVDKEARAESNNETSFVHKIAGTKKKKSGKAINPHEEHKRLHGKEHPSVKAQAADGAEEK